jgi:hypothetical protein
VISVITVTVFWILLSVNVAAQDVLDLQVPEFAVNRATMEEALKKLHLWGIQVCLEKVSRQSEKEDVKISISLHDASVREVLNALVSEDKRYTWERYRRENEAQDTNLINVLPIGAKEDSNNLMNIKIKKVAIKYSNPPENIIPHIGHLVPELARKLYPGGVAGSMAAVIGSKVNLHIDFEFEDMTVREILNEMALRTPGRGWVYEFVKSPQPTHRWRGLP